jgi:hypothetical protein
MKKEALMYRLIHYIELGYEFALKNHLIHIRPHTYIYTYITFVFCVCILNLKVQIVDPKVKHDLQIKISLEIKLYIYICYFLDGYKITSFGWCRNN